MSDPNITLYTAATGNGFKISIMLEELGLPYKLHAVDMKSDEQNSLEFLKINPNGKIPAMTDTLNGREIRLFESGSIMQYLIAEYDPDFKISYPPGTSEYYEMNNWLFFQNSGIGPMQGQSNFFTRFATERSELAINRYQNETKRLYGVLEKHLKESKQDYLVGDKCTIADIAHWGWIAVAGYAGVDIDEFPTLRAWEERMYSRPGVKAGADVPTPFVFKKIMAEQKARDEAAAAGKGPIQQGLQGGEKAKWNIAG